MPKYLGTKPFGNKQTFGRKMTPATWQPSGFLVPKDPANPRGPLTPATQGQIATEANLPTSPPVDPAFEAQKLAANRGVKLGDAFDTYKTGRTVTEYGNVDNPMGELDPYTRAGLLAESFRRAKRGSTNSYAAQGQLYSGALQNAQNENERNFNLGREDLRRGKTDALDALLSNKITRYSQAGVDIDQGALDAILRALGAK